MDCMKVLPKEKIALPHEEWGCLPCCVAGERLKGKKIHVPNCGGVAFEAEDCATFYEQTRVPWKISGKSTGELLLTIFGQAWLTGNCR